MKRSIALLGVATACLLWTAAGAKEIIESRSGDSIKGTRGFDVEEDLRNDQANFRVRVWVDRKDRTYAKGELMRVSVESTESGYLYLIYKQADGSTKCLFPNRFEEDNRIEAGKVVTIPTARQSFRLRCNEPFGDELLVAVVSRKPLAVQKLGAKSLTDDIATKVNLETLAKNLAKGMVCRRGRQADETRRLRGAQCFDYHRSPPGEREAATAASGVVRWNQRVQRRPYPRSEHLP